VSGLQQRVRIASGSWGLHLSDRLDVQIEPDSKGLAIYYDALQMGARKLATLVIDSEHCLTSQHTKGEANIVVDLLSFLSWSGSVQGAPLPLAADDPSDDELTLRSHSHLPQLIHRYFKISPLLSDVYLGYFWHCKQSNHPGFETGSGV
jgi:hypothetical protein